MKAKIQALRAKSKLDQQNPSEMNKKDLELERLKMLKRSGVSQGLVEELDKDLKQVIDNKWEEWAYLSEE